MEWTIATITCTVISRVIYGFRAEVREARKLGQYMLEDKIGEGGDGVVYRATSRDAPSTGGDQAAAQGPRE